jgi:hypothetical protein
MPVYFVQDGPDGPIKIGTTAGDPSVRVAALQTGNPRQLTLLACIPGGPVEEVAMHRRFADLKLHGEWFAAKDRLLGFVEALRYAWPVHDTLAKHTELIGFTADQIAFIRGLFDAWRIAAGVEDGVVTAEVGDGQLELESLVHILAALQDFESAATSAQHHPDDPRNLGVRTGLEVVRASNVAALQAALDRHHAVLGERALMTAHEDAVDPTVSGLAIELHPERYELDLGPLSDEEPMSVPA